MDKGRKEELGIVRFIGSSSINTRQLEKTSASATIPLSRSLSQQPTTRHVNTPRIAGTIAARPLLRTDSPDGYTGREPAAMGGANAGGGPLWRLNGRPKEKPFPGTPIRPSHFQHQAYSSDDWEEEWDRHQQRRRSLRLRPADLEVGYGGVSQPPSGIILGASMTIPAPAARRASLRNPRRRDTIIDNPEVQRSVQAYGQDKELRSKMVRDNVEKLLDDVKSTKDKHTKKALKIIWMLNFAVGLQVTLGALTTGFAAVVRSDNIYIIIALLGGVSTLCASYLARMRGSSEPERSLGFKKELMALKFDLEHFQRRVGELSPMEDYVEERVRRKLSGFQQRYFDIRNAGVRRRFRDVITGGGHMEEQRKSGIVYGQYRS